MNFNISHVTSPLVNKNGFTLIEVMIAIVIFSIGFLAIGAMQIGALNSTNSCRSNTEAMNLAENWAETLRAMPFYADDNLINDDGIGGIDDHDVMPELIDNSGDDPYERDAPGPFTLHWTVTDDEPLPPYPAGVLTIGTTLTKSKTIRIWVTPDNAPEDIQAELTFAKLLAMG